MTTEVKKKMFTFYLKELRTPLLRAKMQDLKNLESRADLKNMIVTIDDLKDEEI